VSAIVAEVKTVEAFAQQTPEYQSAVKKLVLSHAINELYGAQVFDEPAVAYAPTPYWKWLTCRIAMEEYGHHVRFAELGKQIGIPQDAMIPQKTAKKPLSIFEQTLDTWDEFAVLKMLGDLGEIIQVEDLLKCTFVPLRAAARATMPEEKFHVKFGDDACAEICATADGRERIQRAIDKVFPTLPAFFGRSKSRNNAMFREFGLKERTNEAMREDYMNRARVSVEERLGLTLPTIDLAQY